MAVKAMRIQRLTKDAKENLLEDLLKRSPNNYGQYEQGVQEILAHVKEEKDQAVFAYTNLIMQILLQTILRLQKRKSKRHIKK